MLQDATRGGGGVAEVSNEARSTRPQAVMQDQTRPGAQTTESSALGTMQESGSGVDEARG